MAKAYWVSLYRSIKDPDAVAAYAKLAGPALAAARASSSLAVSASISILRTLAVISLS